MNTTNPLLIRDGCFFPRPRLLQRRVWGKKGDGPGQYCFPVHFTVRKKPRQIVSLEHPIQSQAQLFLFEERAYGCEQLSGLNPALKSNWVADVRVGDERDAWSDRVLCDVRVGVTGSLQDLVVDEEVTGRVHVLVATTTGGGRKGWE